ncbi:MAG: TIGR02302 family protein [Hyphomicrobiales bacterium]|nr:MAG: TIGR02302 family protein [Hyphomicrobiales bacterium]
MAQTAKNGPMTGLLARLARTRAAVRAAIVVERLWPLVLPLAVVSSLFASLSWLGVFRAVPDWARLALAAALALAALACLYPLRFFRAPAPAEIDRRIERANRLEHAPLHAQTDRPAAGDAFAQALWREHQKRMAARLDRLGGDLPHARLPERDPWGLRAAAALLAVVAFAFSFGPLGGTLGDALRAHGGAAAVPSRVDAWVTPPAYTGKAPIFLTAQGAAAAEPAIVRVPAGSVVAVRVAGGDGEETLTWLKAGADQPVAVAPEAAAPQRQPRRDAGMAALQFSTPLGENGLLSLSSGGRELRSWAFAVIPDTPPSIRFAHEPGSAVNGTLELSYAIEDDYGVTEAEARFALAEPAAPDARPLYDAPQMPLTLPRRNAADKNARTTRDLTDHPWAGSRVTVTLHAVDAAGQEAVSEEKTIVLPERPFTRPLARALVEQRRILALDANRKGHVLALIDAVTLRPEDTFDNLSHYLGIMAARSRLTQARSDEALRDSADYLWEIALAIEGGAFADARQRLQQAQDALQKALEEGASDEELERLMAELREAMQDFLRELAEQAARDPNMAMDMPSDMQQMRPGDLERMLDQLENLARSGAREQAMDMLQQLRDMMNNLQAGRQQQPGQGQGEQSQMRQQMDQLGEMMRRQQELMNETFRLDNMQRGQNRQNGQGSQPGQGQPMSREEFEEAMRQLQEGQGRLRQDLEGLTRSLEGLGIRPGEGFGEAGEAMGRAEGALGEGEGGRATGEQGQALEALRRGAQDMMQQMQQALRRDGDGGGEGGRQQSADRDPLGRPLATTGPDFGNSVKVPDEIDVERARRILDEIRRRLGNALSPEIERNYLERLLDLR